MKTTKLRLSLLATLCLSAITFYSCSSDDSPAVEELVDSISYTYSDVTKVLDFRPAPGQFVNELPKYEEGDTQEIMNQKALKAISGNKLSMVSLGGFGGYIVMGFDQTIKNIDGRRDFIVLGNAFKNSSEPGIIMVAHDKNKNGKPDEDEWYEIKGSEYSKAKTIHNYEMTFYKPSADLDAKKGDFDNYIEYKNNQGDKGYKPKNRFHDQSYYPLWIKETSLTFKGAKLPNNATDTSGNGTYWILPEYEYGYVDNQVNSHIDAAIDINWAVDKNGKSVQLPGVDFIKVYTAMDQEAGWLGETSTEVSGVIDLHKAKYKVPTR
jgi:hypothetical protein